MGLLHLKKACPSTFAPGSLRVLIYACRRWGEGACRSLSFFTSEERRRQQQNELCQFQLGIFVGATLQLGADCKLYVDITKINVVGSNDVSVFDYIHSQQSNFEKAADTLLKVSGLVFRVYSAEQQQEILRHVYHGSDRHSSKAAICELCSLSAVGTQFSGGLIPPDDGDIMYSVAKQFLDDVIAVSPLRALKVVTLLAIYNMINHATVSLAYIGKSRLPPPSGSLDPY